MHQLALKLALGLLLAACLTGKATAADDYFTGLALQTADLSEQRLIKNALAHVLVKLTGQADISDLPAMQPLLADAQSLLTGFSYREQRAPGNLFDDPDRYLVASFDQRAVLERLRRLGVALWTLERPELLLWLGMEENGERRMLTGEDKALRYVIQQRAEYRGLPLLLPVQDQIDYALVQPATIWGGFYENALLAAERYAVDQTVIATASRMMPTTRLAVAMWQIRWRLHNRHGLETFTSSGNDLASALRAGIDRLAQVSASQSSLSLLADATKRVIARLPEVTDAEQFGRAWQALSGLSQIESVKLLQAGVDGIDLQLQMRADIDWLRQAIDYSDELRRMSPPQTAAKPVSALDRTRISIIILP